MTNQSMAILRASFISGNSLTNLLVYLIKLYCIKHFHTKGYVNGKGPSINHTCNFIYKDQPDLFFIISILDITFAWVISKFYDQCNFLVFKKQGNCVQF